MANAADALGLDMSVHSKSQATALEVYESLNSHFETICAYRPMICSFDGVFTCLLMKNINLLTPLTYADTVC